MGLMHVPRVAAAIARGWLKRRRIEGRTSSVVPRTALDDRSATPTRTSTATVAGMGYQNRYLYHARTRLSEYTGHLNNAAFLTHAELARWELLGYSGIIRHMIRRRTNLVVAGTTIRYRQEIGPLYCPFQVESFVAGLDDKKLWAVHHFRVVNPTGDGTTSLGRIRANLVVPCVFVQRGQGVIAPKQFLVEAGVDANVLDSLSLPIHHHADDVDPLHVNDMVEKYQAMDHWMSQTASTIDQATVKP